MANSHPEPTYYGGRHPGQSIQPTITQEEAALQELMDLITDTMAMEGVNTQEEFGKFKMHFEEITTFLYSRGLSSHSDQFTRCFWNCLSPRLQDAITDSLVFNGHIILDANSSLEELPPYSILVEYIHRSYSPKSIPHEVPRRLSINLENQEPDQSVPIVMSSKEGYGENVSQNFSQEIELDLESTEAAHLPILDSESITSKEIENSTDPSFGVDYIGYPDCQLKSDSNLQPDLSEKSRTIPTPHHSSNNPPGSRHLIKPLLKDHTTRRDNLNGYSCSDNDSMTVDNFLKSSHACKVPIFNNVSTDKLKIQDFSAPTNKAEKKTHLETASINEYPGVKKEEDFQAHNQLSPPMDHERSTSSRQNGQFLVNTIPMIILENIHSNIGTKRLPERHKDLSISSSSFLMFRDQFKLDSFKLTYSVNHLEDKGIRFLAGNGLGDMVSLCRADIRGTIIGNRRGGLAAGIDQKRPMNKEREGRRAGIQMMYGDPDGTAFSHGSMGGGRSIKNGLPRLLSLL
ncbi:hypothetical protein Pst134EA_002509 [Puccinia striiformis f. sp. tritici]|uniref:hypothetical protein n=1 Tax=Puccinia striiformis f. sp. tritici TaxID=168172 RepID=UPI00200731CA|nr:hypothetical protein Pst134EA_002509 [Puccinia striiformis f. sp. tritici]KAH9471876.1 hypothetical protein Pst134EA_002509 [Puccinia striiformis f. sp. tritici]